MLCLHALPGPDGFYELHPAAHAEFCKNMMKMLFGCILADDQSAADIFRRILLHDQTGNLAFPGRQSQRHKLGVFRLCRQFSPGRSGPFMTQADSQMILQPVQYFNLIIGKIPLPGRPVENDFPQQFPFVGQDDATIKLDIVGQQKGRPHFRNGIGRLFIGRDKITAAVGHSTAQTDDAAADAVCIDQPAIGFDNLRIHVDKDRRLQDKLPLRVFMKEKKAARSKGTILRRASKKYRSISCTASVPWISRDNSLIPSHSEFVNIQPPSICQSCLRPEQHRSRFVLSCIS